MDGSAETCFKRAVFRLPLTALLPLSLLLIGAALGPVLLHDLRPGTSLPNRLFYWDANWYDEIAGHGYQWSQAAGAGLGHYSNVAFFPGQALIDWTVAKLTGQIGAAYLILPGLFFGLWSIYAFDRLARAVTSEQTACFATPCFALWPGACFVFMGYPTGLINLCVINALYHTVQARRWRGALWCGLATAAAPTGVFVAVALCISRAMAWQRAHRPPGEIPAMVGLGLATVGGLLCFMAYLLWKFHDPLLFMQAQDAWGGAPPLGAHLLRLINPAWSIAVTGHAAADIFRFLAAPSPASDSTRNAAAFQYQQVLSFAALTLAIAAVLAASRTSLPRVLTLAGFIVVAGYMWFMATTNAYMVNGVRLLYPAPVIFLMCGAWAASSNLWRWLLPGCFAVLDIMQAALTTTGYPVN